MSLRRIGSLLLQQWYITKSSLEVVIDVFVGSVVNTVVVGFVTKFLLDITHSQEATYILLGTVLWAVLYATQYAMSVDTMWNIWSHNLGNLFIAPVSLGEYIVAAMLSGVVKTALTFIPVVAVAWWLFDFNLFALGGLNIVLYIFNLMLFGWAAGLVFLAFVFRYGTRVQALTWGLIPLLQPLVAAFFPLSVLPAPLQWLGYVLPPTWVFEVARGALTSTAVHWVYAGIAFGENVLYFIVAVWFFKLMFKASKNSGQFARNEA